MTATPEKSKNHRAREALAAASAEYPAAWSMASELREDNGKPGMPSWPDWCYLPVGGWYAVVSHLRHGGREISSLASIADVARLAALGTWRMTQGIYRFDPALYPDLVETPIDGDIPCDVLYRLPEWCVYLETPGLTWGGAPLHGVWAHLEHDGNTSRPELRLLADMDARLEAAALHLGPWSLQESLERMAQEARAQAAKRGMLGVPDAAMAGPVRDLAPIVSLLLYVCSTAADFNRRGEDGQPVHPQPKKTKRGWRLFAANGPTEWDVGVRLGAALRRAYAAEQMTTGGAHTGPRPHVRRAHWHTILSGPRKSEDGSEISAAQRKRELRWMPPIPVNMDDAGKLPAVIRPVD